jgi:hypothetical protein
MDDLNKKYFINRKKFAFFINKLCEKKGYNISINENDKDFIIIKKLNKLFLNLKFGKYIFNVLEDEILKIISLDKKELTLEEIEQLYIYFYFYNSIQELEEIPKFLIDKNMRWQIIKQIDSDLNFIKTYSYIDGEIYLNKK